MSSFSVTALNSAVCSNTIHEIHMDVNCKLYWYSRFGRLPAALKVSISNLPLCCPWLVYFGTIFNNAVNLSMHKCPMTHQLCMICISYIYSCRPTISTVISANRLINNPRKEWYKLSSCFLDCTCWHSTFIIHREESWYNEQKFILPLS